MRRHVDGVCVGMSGALGLMGSAEESSRVTELLRSILDQEPVGVAVIEPVGHPFALAHANPAPRAHIFTRQRS